MKTRIPTLLSVCLLAAGASLSADRIPIEDGMAEFDVPGSETITFAFQHHRADIEIIGHDANVVRIEVANDSHEPFASFLDWDEARRSLRLDLSNSPGTRSVRIWLPYQSGINLQGVESEVTVKDIRGNAVVRLVNGDLGMDGASGAILVELVNGNATVKPVVSSSTEPISIMSQNGDISLIVPKDFRGTANMNTVAGEITCDLPGADATGPSAKSHAVNLGPMSRLTTPINGGGRPVILNTVNGDIELRTP